MVLKGKKGIKNIITTKLNVMYSACRDGSQVYYNLQHDHHFSEVELIRTIIFYQIQYIKS